MPHCTSGPGLGCGAAARSQASLDGVRGMRPTTRPNQAPWLSQQRALPSEPRGGLAGTRSCLGHERGACLRPRGASCCGGPPLGGPGCRGRLVGRGVGPGQSDGPAALVPQDDLPLKALPCRGRAPGSCTAASHPAGVQGLPFSYLRTPDRLCPAAVDLLQGTRSNAGVHRQASRSPNGAICTILCTRETVKRSDNWCTQARRGERARADELPAHVQLAARRIRRLARDGLPDASCAQRDARRGAALHGHLERVARLSRKVHAQCDLPQRLRCSRCLLIGLAWDILRVRARQAAAGTHVGPARERGGGRACSRSSPPGGSAARAWDTRNGESLPSRSALMLAGMAPVLLTRSALTCSCPRTAHSLGTAVPGASGRALRARLKHVLRLGALGNPGPAV